MQEPNCTIAPSFPGPGDFTGVVGEIGFCQAVPKSVDSGYKVMCDTSEAGERLPRGTFSVCQDYPLCASCNAVTRFTDDSCIEQVNVKQSQDAFGSASLQLQCTNPLLPSALPPPGRALIAWFELSECGELDRTLVDVRLDVCNRVPRGVDGGCGIPSARSERRRLRLL